MPRLLLFAIPTLFALAAPALAESGMIANCKEGGCTCVITAGTQEELAVLYGLEEPPSAESMVVLAPDIEPFWSGVSPGDLDLNYNGDGTCEMALFDDVVPKDGQWAGTVVAEKVEGCPAQMAPALKEATVAMATTRQIAWGGSYHPDKLRDDQKGKSVFTWTDKGGGAWTGVSTLNQSGPLALNITTTSRIEAEDSITAGMQITIGMKAGDATAAGILKSAGLTNCRVTARYSFARIGD